MRKCIDCKAEGARAFFGTDDDRPDGPLCRECWERRFKESQEQRGHCPLCASIPAQSISEEKYILKAENYLSRRAFPQKDINVRFAAGSEIERYVRGKAEKDKTSVTAVIRNIIWEHMEGRHEQT